MKVPAQDWAFWTNAAKAAGNNMMKNDFANVASTFAGLADQVTRDDWGKEVAPGITSIDTSGHRLGHSSLAVASGSSKLLVQADVTNLPELFLRHPDWHVAFDVDPDKAVTTRRRLYDMAATERALAADYHFAFPSMGLRQEGRHQLPAGAGTVEPLALGPMRAPLHHRSLRVDRCVVDRRDDRLRAPRSRAAPFRCRLIIMAKAPVAGRVKTRLAGEAGLGTTLRFVRHSLAGLMQRVGRDARWSTALAVTPDGAGADLIRPRGVTLMRQGSGDLGHRMQRLMENAPPGPVVIVGTDIPDITRAHVAAAFRALGRHDAVLGPAADGGYWLVGLRRRPRRLRPFANVRWSSPHALADTLAGLRGRSVGLLPILRDVDTAADLAECAGRWGRRIRCRTSEYR